MQLSTFAARQASRSSLGTGSVTIGEDAAATRLRVESAIDTSIDDVPASSE